MDEKRMRTGHCLTSVICVSFTQLVGDINGVQHAKNCHLSSEVLLTTTNNQLMSLYRPFCVSKLPQLRTRVDDTVAAVLLPTCSF